MSSSRPLLEEEVLPARRGGRWRAELRPWQRFHLKLLWLYGGATVVLLALFSGWIYQQRVEGQLRQVQAKILLLAQSLAQSVDGDKVFGLPDAELRDYWEGEAYGRFARVKELDPTLSDLYVMRITERTGHFEILFDFDYARQKHDSAWLEPYDGTRFPRMIEGLERPTVEDRAWTDEYQSSISAYAPIRDASGRTVAFAGVDLLAEDARQMRRQAMVNTGIGLLAVLVVLGGVSLVVGRLITRPLGEVIDATEAIAGGDLDVRIRPKRRDEFGLLGRTFDAMADGLQEREFLRETFGRYVSPSVAESILEDHEVTLGGELREVTVLFSDLRGYSTITERAEPGEVVRLLNDYFGAMNEVIEAHEGVVIEFLGDGILAVFNAPAPVEGHAVRGVEAALAMRQRLRDLNRRWEEAGHAHLWRDVGLEHLVARVGLHTGTVVAGNLGSADRMKYAVIGDNVNIAARLEQLNKELGTTILLSEAVKARLPEARFPLHPKGASKVKGRGDPIDVYAL